MSDIDPDAAALTEPEVPDASGVSGSARRAVQRAVVRMRAFAAAHDGATATVEYLGRNGARVILLGGDGVYGDVVLGSPDRSGAELAEQVCATAGLEIAEWDRERSAAVRISPADRQRMAGTGR